MKEVTAVLEREVTITADGEFETIEVVEEGNLYFATGDPDEAREFLVGHGVREVEELLAEAFGDPEEED